MCDTGIALLAYMDGITGSPTLGGVVLAVLSAAGYAVFKVTQNFNDSKQCELVSTLIAGDVQKSDA